MQLHETTRPGPRPPLNGRCGPPTKKFAHPWARVFYKSPVFFLVKIDVVATGISFYEAAFNELQI